MKVIVLGAGIAGITAAYALGRRGHSVEVIERESAAAMQTSFANGGQLSYTHAEPWANPGALPKVLKWMFRDDAPLVLRPRADIDMLRWGLMFLRNCTRARAHRHTEIMLRLGLYSREQFSLLREETGIAFDFLDRGILHIFSHEKDFQASVRQVEFQATLGCHEEILTREQCLQKEPALQQVQKPVVGGIFSPLDQSGDIHLFTQRLADYCVSHFAARMHYGVSFTSFEKQGSRISGIVTDRGVMQADAYVMALGPWCAPLLKRIGIRVPIYPMKGYSVTLPAWENAPVMSVTDDEKKVVVSRLGNRIRAAGTAEFAGYNTDVREKRITPILQSLRELFPASAAVEHVEKWACIRPQTPDGPPVIGKTRYENVFMHTGHGTLGWTQCAGTSRLLADIVENRPTDIPLDGITLSRYGI